MYAIDIGHVAIVHSREIDVSFEERVELESNVEFIFD